MDHIISCENHQIYISEVHNKKKRLGIVQTTDLRTEREIKQRYRPKTCL